MWVWVLHHRGLAIVLFRLHVKVDPSPQRICKSPFSDCMWEWVLTHRGFSIVLWRLDVSVGPYSQRICNRPFQIACESGSLLTEDLLSSCVDCMWVWVLTHRGFTIFLLRMHVSESPSSQRICYCSVQSAVESGSYSQRICYRPVQIAWECGSLLTENLLSSFSDCMWEWVLTHRWFTIILFLLYVRVDSYSQRICYRPVQIACDNRSLLTEDLLSSCSDCMWEWVLTHRGFAIVLFRLNARVGLHYRGFVFVLLRLKVFVGLSSKRICFRPFQMHVSVGLSSQRICYHPVQIVC